jgi:hypothetical protein
MKSLIESVKAMYAPRTEATMMKDDGKMVHNCAKHVEHAEYGTGNCIAEEHADPDRYGNIAWYDIEFPHGIEKGVPVSELKILQAESHGHQTKKAKKMAEGKGDGNLANNYPPYDKVTKGDVIAGRLGKDEMGGKKKVKEELENAPKDLGGDAGKQADKKKKFKDAETATAKSGGPLTAEPGSKIKEEVEVDETIIHRDLEYTISEADKNFDTYFKAKMKANGGMGNSEDEKKAFFKKVDAGYKAKNEETFVEAFMHSDLEDVKNAHRKSGNRIADEKSGTREGKPFHSFVVTTPEGKRTRHIYHGSTKKLETMSPAKKSKQAQEQDLDDKE